MAQMHARHLVLAPLHHVVTFVGRPEPTAEAVGKGVEIPAEVANGSVDRFADDAPEVFQCSDLRVSQHVCRCHSSDDMYGSAQCLADSERAPPHHRQCNRHHRAPARTAEERLRHI